MMKKSLMCLIAVVSVACALMLSGCNCCPSWCPMAPDANCKCGCVNSATCKCDKDCTKCECAKTKACACCKDSAACKCAKDCTKCECNKAKVCNCCETAAKTAAPAAK
jgi:hypothetical protein